MYNTITMYGADFCYRQQLEIVGHRYVILVHHYYTTSVALSIRTCVVATKL